MPHSPEEQFALEQRVAFEERMLEDGPDLYGEYAWLLPGIPSRDGEHIVELCREIQQSHAAKCIDGVLVDAWTAAAVVTLADNLNATNRVKFIQRRTVESMGKVAQDVCFRAKNT